MFFSKFKKICKYFKLLIRGREYYAKSIGVKIGKNCRIYIHDWGTEPFLISIGNNCTITSGVKFITHDGSTWLMRDEKGRRYIFTPIEIGNSVFVGMNSIIMQGVKIEDRVIVGAGSVVTKSVPTGSIVAGVPAKIIGNYDEIEKRMLNSYISEKDINHSLNYKERIMNISSNTYKSYLK